MYLIKSVNVIVYILGAEDSSMVKSAWTAPSAPVAMSRMRVALM
jgi:hypothetical protein